MQERSFNWFKLIVDGAPHAMLLIDVRGCISLVNQAGERLFGCENSALVGQPFDDLFPARYHPVAQLRRRELVALRKDGVELPVELGLNSIDGPDGAFTVAAIVDLTERRSAETLRIAQASQQQTFFEELLENLPFAVNCKDAEDGYRLTFANGRNEEAFGVRRADLIGKSIFDLLPREAAEAAHQADIEVIESRKSLHLPQQRIELPTMGRRAVRTTKIPISTGGARPRFILSITEDVTEAARAERLRQMQLLVTRILAEGTSLEACAPRLLQIIGEHIERELTALWWIAPLTQRLGHQAHWSSSSDAQAFAEESQGFSFACGEGLPGRVWKESAPAVIPHLASAENFPRREKARQRNFQGGFAFPIVGKSGVYGVIEAFCHRHEDAPADLLAVLTDLGRQIGSFHDRTSAESERDRFFSIPLNFQCVAGIDGYFKRINSAFEVLGYSREELLNKPFLEFVHPDDVPATLEEVKKLAGGATSIHFENRYRCSDGSYRWLLWSAVPDASGKLYAAARDITEQKTAAASLRRALSFQSALLESAAIAIIATDRQGTFTSFNGAAERMLGYARDEVIGKLTPKALHKPAEVVARAAELSRELVRPFTPGFDVFTTVPRERGVEEREWTFVRKDGSEFPAQLSVTPLRDEAENIDGYLGIAVDVTERRRAAAAIRESEERFRLMVAGVSDYAILMLDPAGHVATWNDGAERVKGFRAEEIVGQHFSRFYTPEDLARGKPAETLRLAAQDGSYEDKGGWRVRKDGSRFFANSVLTAMRDEAGTLRGFSKITRDITQRKRDEERLQEATRKLERSNRDLSEFASIASHDLQEPLRKIRTFGDRLKSKLTDASPDALDSLERMNGAAMRMQQLISNLLAYSRVSSRAQAPVAVDLNHVLKDVLSDLDARIEETGGRVEVSLLPIVQGDPTQLRQLFQNLVGNALKFRKPDEAPRVRVAVDSGQLVVEDNGIGFEQRYAERIFGIFERLHARQEYEGTGIGLSICRKIVERHGGTIEAHGEPGRGSRFTITFPSTS